MWHAPSGRALSEEDLLLIKLMLQTRFIRFVGNHPLHLSSGRTSSFYVGGREDTTNYPVFMDALGRKIREKVLEEAETLREPRRPCLLGIQTAGATLAQAAVMAQSKNGPYDKTESVRFPLFHRVVRQHAKNYGANRSHVDGEAETWRDWYVLVDNTVTTGNTILSLTDAFRDEGYPIPMPVVIPVDREDGGADRLRKQGFTILSCFVISDVSAVAVELGTWTRDQSNQVAREIEEQRNA